MKGKGRSVVMRDVSVEGGLRIQLCGGQSAVVRISPFYKHMGGRSSPNLAMKPEFRLRASTARAALKDIKTHFLASGALSLGAKDAAIE
eukprot:7335961-Alexandrium_andersonii.AAC.1